MLKNDLHCWLVYLDTARRTAYSKPEWKIEHLGLAYLSAAARRAGFNVRVLNAAAEGKSTQDVCQELCRPDVDFVGFSVTCITVRDALTIAETLKSGNSRIHICFGGQHATCAAEELLRNHTAVDSIVRGSGELTLVELLRALQDDRPFTGIEGIYYRDETGEIHMNPDRAIPLNLDTVPFPERGPEGARFGAYTIYTSRGCLNTCSFCSSPLFNRIQGLSGWQARSADDVVKEIELLCRSSLALGPVDISLMDDNFFVDTEESKSRAANIARRMIEMRLNATLYFMVGAFSLSVADRELLGLLRQAGFQRALLGIEAGSTDTLKVYGKPTSRDRNVDAMGLMSEYGFMLHCTMILFHPYSSMDEMRKNARFVMDALQRPNVCCNTTYCSKMMAFPGTGLTERLKRDGLLTSTNAYLDPYSYRFVDPHVEMLAAAMGLIEGEMASIDWKICDIRSILTRHHNHTEGSEWKKHQDQANMLIRDLSQNIFELFMKAASAAERADEEELHDVIAQYRANLMQHEGLLEDCWHKTHDAYSRLFLGIT